MVEAGVHSMFLRKKNLKFFCCSFEKNVRECKINCVRL